jgi:FtsH-binding integral membrane protein
MNEAHYHLLVNHLPIIIPIVGVLVLIGGFLLKSAIVKRTAFAIFILGAVTAFAAIATGEGAEHVLKQQRLAEMKVIHTHEEVAETFAIASYILATLSLIALWASWKRKSFANILAVAALIVVCVTLYFGTNTGLTGGEVRHTEIRKGPAPGNNAVNNTPPESDGD